MSCLRQVTLVMVYPTQVITRNDDINMLRPELFQPNGQCLIMIMFCLLQVTQLFMYISHVIISSGKF